MAEESERRKNMTQLMDSIADLNEQVHTMHEELRVFLAQYTTEYKATCSRLATVSAELEKVDTDIRGNGKPGLSERISRVEQKLNWLTAILAIIGVGALGFAVDRILTTTFP